MMSLVFRVGETSDNMFRAFVVVVIIIIIIIIIITISISHFITCYFNNTGPIV
jgi:hypothetical protein